MNKFMPVSARKLRLLTKKNGRTHRCAPTRIPTYGVRATPLLRIQIFRNCMRGKRRKINGFRAFAYSAYSFFYKLSLIKGIIQLFPCKNLYNIHT